MRVLISGGLKTQNIVTGLEKKFSSGGIEFIIVPYIDEIESIFSRGEYYDRALIIEPSWTQEYTDRDPMSIRNRINDFAIMAKERGLKGLNYVFLSQSEEMADIVNEEILLIKSVSINVVKAPRYSVNFFASLVSTSFEQFPDNIVYNPIIEVPEDVEETKVEVPKETYSAEEIDDISRELFDVEESHAPGLNDYSRGVDVVRETERVVKQEAEVEEDDTDDFQSLFDELENIAIEDDVAVEEEEEEDPFRFSGDLPEFNGDSFEESLNLEEIDIEEDVSIDNELGNLEGIEDEPFDTPMEFETERESGELPSFEDEQYRTSGELPSFDIPVNDTLDRQEFEDTSEVNTIDDSLYEDNTPKKQDFSIGVNKEEDYTSSTAFDESYYKEDKQEELEEPVTNRLDMKNLDNVKHILDAFANRGNSIVVTGAGGCGTSTVAYNLANTINNLGYTVLLVDMDTENKTQSFISKDNYNCVEIDGANLMQALKTSAGINTYVSIVKPGFRLLTMGLGGDIVPLEKMIQTQKLNRFINAAKSNHQFVIYDIPFKNAVGCVGDVSFMADNLVIVSDCSSWGLTKTLSHIGNIENEDLQDIFFCKGQLLFNRVRQDTTKLLGKKVKSFNKIPYAMDSKLKDLLGAEPPYRFSDMHVCGGLGVINSLEGYWYESKQYSDTEEGFKVFTEILVKTVLKK